MSRYAALCQREQRFPAHNSLVKAALTMAVSTAQRQDTFVARQDPTTSRISFPATLTFPARLLNRRRGSKILIFMTLRPLIAANMINLK